MTSKDGKVRQDNMKIWTLLSVGDLDSTHERINGDGAGFALGSIWRVLPVSHDWKREYMSSLGEER